MTDLPDPPEGLELSQAGADANGMFRSIFGEPKPRNLSQLNEAIYEMMLDIETVFEVAITDSTSEPEDTVWYGWTAEIRTETPAGDAGWISTGGWPSREALVDDLKSVGIRESLMVDED